jgi:2-polyprenyl-6-methoxyphenol hydroxylase-like FAD-dependent oxidoreductase
MTVRAPKVIIIGGGIAGPALALALKKHNIASVVFELRPERSAHDGGYFTLAPNALRVLESVGVYDQICPHGYHYEDIDLLSSRHLAVLGRVSNGSHKDFGFQALRISRRIVRQALLSQLQKQDIEIRYGARCVKIVEKDKKVKKEGSYHGNVTVEFANGQVENGDFVIGADGIHSCVRKYIDSVGHSEPQYTGLIGLIGTMDRSRLPAECMNIYLPCLILGKDNSSSCLQAMTGKTLDFSLP